MSKVLLVEDDINLREIYAARLSAEGHELVVASDGEEALSKAVAEKPDLILLDVMMPKISGFDVLDILRSTEETKNTKVVMLSALSQETDKQRGENLGADKYLIKSQITLEDVVETVREMLEGGGGAGDGATPIVTTSNGRLPDNNAGQQNPEEPDTQPDVGVQNQPNPVAPPQQPGNPGTQAPDSQNQQQNYQPPSSDQQPPTV